MFCPICNNEVEKNSEFCPSCGTNLHLKNFDDNNTFIFQPVFIKWYEILNYLIHHILWFTIIMIVGYFCCAYVHISPLLLILLFPIYVGIGFIKTRHLEQLYRGITFTFYSDHVVYENYFYPRLNGQLYYDNIARMTAYQSFLDYFFGIGHIKIKSISNPRCGMILKNVENPNETYESIKAIMAG